MRNASSSMLLRSLGRRIKEVRLSNVGRKNGCAVIFNFVHVRMLERDVSAFMNETVGLNDNIDGRSWKTAMKVKKK